MDRWVVELTATPHGRRRFSDDDADELLDLLEPYDPVLELTPGALEASLTVEAYDVSEAVMRAYHAFRENLLRAKLDPDVPITRAVAYPEDQLSETEPPSVPADFVGISEIARMIKVSPQRASQLADESWFPAPLAEIAAGRIWDRSTVERAVARWDRSPGRPRKVRARR